MDIDFDPAKDAINIRKHGLSLARAADLDVLAIVEDYRFDEHRVRMYGLIDGAFHCAAIARRGETVRVISLRRAHAKEVRRHV